MGRLTRSKLNIVIVVTYTYPYIGSGIGNVALNQAVRLSKLGHNVTIISSNYPKSKSEFKRNGVTHLKMNANFILEKFNVPMPLFVFNKKAKEAIKNSDIVHIHDSIYVSSLLAVFLAKKYKSKVVLTQHIAFLKYKSLILNILQKIAYLTIGKYVFKNSDSIIYFNPQVEALVKQYKNVINLPNGVDTNIFKPVSNKAKENLKKEFKLPTEKKIVLFVGRFVPKKGYQLLFEARNSEYLTIFVGGGIVPDEFNVDPNVKVFPPQTQTQLAKLYQLSDLFILPSYGEGFPLSIQEAISTGIPVITNKENIFDDDLSFINTIELSVSELKEKINEVLKKDNSQLISKQRNFALSNYSWAKNIGMLVKMYKEIL
jgi:glycosyltransferase involved in cell wall biosynthesis